MPGRSNARGDRVVLDGDDHPEADWLYEIGLDGDVCDAMRRTHPTAQVTAAGTSTILSARLRRPEDLHVLLDALADFGLTPGEVHESAGRSYPDQGSGLGPSRAVEPPYAVLRGADYPAGWARPPCTTWAGRTGWFGRRWSGLRASHRSLRVVLDQMADGHRSGLRARRAHASGRTGLTDRSASAQTASCLHGRSTSASARGLSTDRAPGPDGTRPSAWCTSSLR